jgi:hypothetical protein
MLLMPRLSSLWMWGGSGGCWGRLRWRGCLAALPVEALGVLGEQQGCLGGLLGAFVKVGGDGLL